MKLRIIVFFSFLLIACALPAQTLHSIIVNEQNEPIAQAHIKIGESRIGTITDKKGQFWINYHFKYPIIMEVSHVGFETQKITIKSKEDIPNTIKLTYKLIPGISINSNPVINIIPEKKLYVYDYELLNDTLILLCFANKKASSRYVVLIDKYGEELNRYAISKAQNIGVDPEKRMFYCTSKELIYIRLLNNKIEEISRHPKLEYLDLMKMISYVDEEVIYAKKYFKNDQILVHFNFKMNQTQPHEITEISNTLAIDRLNDPHSWMRATKMTDYEKRFEKMCFYSPIYAPLYVSKNEVIILNFIDRLIERYDTASNKIEFTKMEDDFQQPDNILFDSETQQFYAYYEQAGKSQVHPIDIKNGLLADPITIPEYAFVEKVNIKDSEIFFLYKENASDDYKKIYKMSLNYY